MGRAIRESTALVCIDEVWVSAALVEEADPAEWKRLKATGPGKDPRLLGDERRAVVCAILRVPANSFIVMMRQRIDSNMKRLDAHLRMPVLIFLQVLEITASSDQDHHFLEP